MARHDPTNRILQLALVMVALVAVPTSGQVLKKPAQCLSTFSRRESLRSRRLQW